MRNWIFALAIATLSILQVTLLDYLKVFGVKPDLLLICVVIASVSLELKWVLFFAIFSGFLKDIFAPGAFGINILMLPLWGFLTRQLSKKISIDNDSRRMVLIFVIVIFNDIASRMIFLFLGNPSISLGIFLRIIILESLYTALVSPLVFRIIKLVFLKDLEETI